MTEIVAEAVRRNLVKSYTDGYTDGVKETLLQLLGESATVPPPGFVLPDDIERWALGVLKRVQGR